MQEPPRYEAATRGRPSPTAARLAAAGLHTALQPACQVNSTADTLSLRTIGPPPPLSPPPPVVHTACHIPPPPARFLGSPSCDLHTEPHQAALHSTSQSQSLSQQPPPAAPSLGQHCWTHQQGISATLSARCALSAWPPIHIPPVAHSQSLS
jgi:hypothetical protein